MTSPQLLLENQICHSLYSAANALVRAYRPYLEPLGLTYPQYLVMLSLWERDGVSITTLVRHTRLDKSTVTPLLKRLEAKGLLQRTPAPHSEREKVVTLTPQGRRLKRRAEKIPEQLATSTGMSEQQGMALKELCEALYQRLSE